MKKYTLLLLIILTINVRATEVKTLTSSPSDEIVIPNNTTGLQITFSAELVTEDPAEEGYSVRFVLSTAATSPSPGTILTELCSNFLLDPLWYKESDGLDHADRSCISTITKSMNTNNATTLYVYAVISKSDNTALDDIYSEPIEIKFESEATPIPPPDPGSSVSHCKDPNLGKYEISAPGCVTDNTTFNISGRSSFPDLMIDCGLFGDLYAGELEWFKSTNPNLNQSAYTSFSDEVGPGFCCTIVKEHDLDCYGTTDAINKITYYYRKSYKWTCGLFNYGYDHNNPVNTSNTITVYPSSFNLQASMSQINIKDNRAQPIQNNKISNCNMYTVGVTISDPGLDGSKVHYKWTIPAGWSLSNASLEGDGLSSISVTPTNLRTASSGEFKVDVTFVGGCRTETYTLSRTVQYFTINEKPSVLSSNGGTITTGTEMTFGRGTGPATGNKTWSFYTNGRVVDPSHYTIGPAGAPEYNTIDVTFNENFFTNSGATSAIIQAKYYSTYTNACSVISTEFSNDVYLLSQNYVPGAPIIGNGSYNGICVGSPVTIKSNDLGTVAKTWQFYLNGSTTPLSVANGDYVINSTTAENIKVTFNQSALANTSQHDNALIKITYTTDYGKVSLPLNGNIFAANPLVQRPVSISNLCTNGAGANVNVELLGDVTYKTVTFYFRYKYGTKYYPILNPSTGFISFPARQLVDKSWLAQASINDEYAGTQIQWRVKVETACGAYYMYDWPTVSGNQSFTLQSGTPPAMNVTMTNGRESDSGSPRGYCITDQVTLISDFTAGSNPGAINNTQWSIDFIDHPGPVYQTQATGNTLTLNLSNIPGLTTGEYMRVQATSTFNNTNSCANYASSSNAFVINHYSDTLQAPVPTLIPNPRLTNNCVGNFLSLSSSNVQGAVSYEWLTPDGQTYIGQNSKILITSGLPQIASYSVRANNGSCVSSYSVLNVDITNVLIPPTPTYAGYQDVTGRLNTKYREINVTSTNTNPYAIYEWYYGQSTDCFGPNVNQQVDQFNNSNQIAVLFDSYELYGQTYYNMPRCDYTVVLYDQKYNCSSEHLVVYTDGDQSPQYRKGLTDSTIANSSAIKLYPNPAIDQLTVETGFDNYQVQIVNLVGSIISSKQALQPITNIDLSNITSGMYLVNIIHQGNITRRKIEVFK